MMQWWRPCDQSPSTQLESRVGLGSIECLLFQEHIRQSWIKNWTEQGREIKLIAIKMFKILIKNIQKNMIYVRIDP